MSLANPARNDPNVEAGKNPRSGLAALNPAQRYLDGVATLPPAPMLVTELLTLFREPDRDIDEVVKLISYEPALTAQILRVCNSACFATEQPPGDIFEAVSRMGFYQVYCLVVSIFGARTRSTEGAAKGVNVEELWRHSVAVAVASSVVEEEAGHQKAVAFTAGLVHDIGKLVLASAERERYGRLIQNAKDHKLSLSALERSAFGTDHAELGGELMRRWNLPPDVVAAVRHHHQIEASPPYEQLTAAVQIANMIAHQLFAEAEKSAEPDLLKSCGAALDVLLLLPDDVPRLLARTQAEMDKVKGTLEI
jgi:putative nucleotidyltransferase with HDIG domain